MKIATKFNSKIIKDFTKHSNKITDKVIYFGTILFFLVALIFILFKEYAAGLRIMIFSVVIISLIPLIKSTINEKAFSYFDNLEIERVIEYNVLEEGIGINIYENGAETRKINVKYTEILHVNEVKEYVYVYASNHCVYVMVKDDIENISELEEMFVKNNLKYRKVK